VGCFTEWVNKQAEEALREGILRQELLCEICKTPYNCGFEERR
jgi:hypothetical protein